MNKEHDMGRIGLPEMLVILLIVILIFGANRLPEIGRGIGKGIKNFKDATKEGAAGKEED
jgi:sec-independent protein translocase protein TatA